MRRSEVLLALLFIFPTFFAWSASSDAQQPMFAKSDQAEFNQKTSIGVYTGNVSATQGTTELVSARLTTYLNSDTHQLNHAIAEGTPAVYTTELAPEKPRLVAKANRIEYYPLEAKVDLLGHAIVTQGNDSYSAQVIHYDLQNQRVMSPKTGDPIVMLLHTS